MTDRIIELAKLAGCVPLHEDGDSTLMFTQKTLQRLAELVRNDAVDATCQDSRHVPGCVDAGMQAAPMQAQFTDDELDLFRQWYNSVQDTNGGYLVELDHALFRKLRAIKEAPVQEPETVSVLGVKPNGEVVDTGVKAPMPPRMKARDFVNEMYGRAWIEEDDGSDADMCFAVCEQFFEWLVAQGWAAQPRTAVPEVDDAPIPPDSRELKQQPSKADLFGLRVSVDVSTGDHDAGNRLFGSITDILDTKPLTLICDDARPNYQPRKAVKLSDADIHNADPLPHAMFDTQRTEFARALEAIWVAKNGFTE